MISIRSYSRREGRMIPSRQRALDESWLDYGITAQGPLALDELFGRPAPCYLEIGFGMGDVLLEMARTHPKYNYLGVEVYLPGVGQLLLSLRETGITNVRIDRRDAMEVLALLPAGSLAPPYSGSDQANHQRSLDIFHKKQANPCLYRPFPG